MCSRFDTEEEVIRSGINIFKKFIQPQGFDTLILGEKSVLDPQFILVGDKDLVNKANRLYNTFEEYGGWGCEDE